MGINMFDKPAEAQFMNTYVELPFKEIAAMGEQLDKTRGEAEATVASIRAQHLKAITDEDQDDQKRAQEIMKAYDEKIAKIPDMYYSDTKGAKRYADQLAQEMDRDMKRGEWHSIAAREEQRQAHIKEINDLYKDQPEARDYYLSQLGAKQRNYDPATGSFQQVTTPNRTTLIKEEDRNKRITEALNIVHPDTFLKEDLNVDQKKLIYGKNFTEIYQNPGLREFIDPTKLTNQMALAVSGMPEVLRSSEEWGNIYGQGPGQGNIFVTSKEGDVLTGSYQPVLNEDGTQKLDKDKKPVTEFVSFNNQSALGRYLNGVVDMKSYTKDTGNTFITVKDTFGEKAAIKKLEEEVEAGTIGTAVGEKITTNAKLYKDYLNKAIPLQKEIATLKANLAKNPNAKDAAETKSKIEGLEANMLLAKEMVGEVSTKTDEKVIQKLGANYTDALKAIRSSFMATVVDPVSGATIQEDGIFALPDSWFNWNLSESSAIVQDIATKSGYSAETVKKVLISWKDSKKEVAEETAYSPETIVPAIYNDSSTGKFASIFGEIIDLNTQSYVGTAATGWLNMDGTPAETKGEELSNKNRTVFSTDQLTQDGKGVIQAVSVKDDKGNTISTKNVYTTDKVAMDNYKKLANTLISSKSVDQVARGYEMLGKSVYQGQINAIEFESLQPGDRRRTTIHAPASTQSGVVKDQVLYIVATKGADPSTIEYSFQNAAGKVFITAGSKEGAFELLGQALYLKK